MTSFVYIWNLNQLKNSFLYDLDALLEYHLRHVKSSAGKDITQETQSNHAKVSPFCFIPEVTSYLILKKFKI